VRAVLAEAGLGGLEVRRGVEDLAAHEAGINNEATALGLVQLFRVFAEPGFLPEPQRAEGMGILFAQEFRAMLPAKLPKGVRVANKTGEISTHSHDAGLVFPSSGRPYAVAILTESSPKDDRTKAVAEMSRALFDFVQGPAK
jgi:beta-lactamase class A